MGVTVHVGSALWGVHAELWGGLTGGPGNWV